MQIHPPQIRRAGTEVEWRVTVEGLPGPPALWFRVDSRWTSLLTDLSDPALAALLIPAMAAGTDTRVAGPLSERLWFQLSGCCQPLLQRLLRGLHPIRIDARQLRDSGPRPAGVATGFTGGIDSWCVIADHHLAAAPQGFKLTHLVFNHVGSHGAGGERLFRERAQRLAPAAERIGLPLVLVASNLADFYDERLSYLHTHALRHAAVALLLQGGIGRYLSASTYPHDRAALTPASGLTCDEPLLLPLLGSGRLELFSAGGAYTRVQKILRLADIPETWQTLDVCIHADRAGNCSQCEKCLRTLATIEIAGLAQRYAAVFDLARYRRRGRLRYFAIVRHSRNDFCTDIAALARQRRFAWPWRARLYGWLRWPLTRLEDAVEALGIRRPLWLRALRALRRRQPKCIFIR